MTSAAPVGELENLSAVEVSRRTTEAVWQIGRWAGGDEQIVHPA
jgi:hypothetical protein